MGLHVEELLTYDDESDEDGDDVRNGRMMYLIYYQPTWLHLTCQMLWRLTLYTRPLELLVDRVFPPKDEWELPFGARVDGWIFDLNNKRRTEIAMYDPAEKET